MNLYFPVLKTIKNIFFLFYQLIFLAAVPVAPLCSPGLIMDVEMLRGYPSLYFINAVALVQL